MHERRLRTTWLIIVAGVGVIAWNGTAAAGAARDAPTRQPVRSAKATVASKPAVSSRVVESGRPGAVAPPATPREMASAARKAAMPSDEQGLGCARAE